MGLLQPVWLGVNPGFIYSESILIGKGGHMQRIEFCSRCRGMKVGWNTPYLVHSLVCKTWISPSSKLLVLTVFVVVLLFTFSTPNAVLYSRSVVEQHVAPYVTEPAKAAIVDPSVHAMEIFLKNYGVAETHLTRVAKSIVTSAKKYNLAPRLIASIVIVESRANPFAVSHADSVGIMQIHVPTWAKLADREGINLFKVEDNIDFGARILRDYVRQSGLWTGVKRYNGWLPENPESETACEQYLAKVQRIYGSEEPVASTAQLLQ